MRIPIVILLLASAPAYAGAGFKRGPVAGFRTGVAATSLTQDITLNDDVQLEFGSSSDAMCEYDTAIAPDALVCGIGTDSRVLYIVDSADIGTNWAKAQQTNPTLCIQSADQATTSDRVCLAHDQTDGRITTDGGNLKLAPAGGTVDVTGGVMVGSTDSYKWSGRSILTSSADGKLKLTNSADTAGLVIDTASSAFNIYQSDGTTYASVKFGTSLVDETNARMRYLGSTGVFNIGSVGGMQWGTTDSYSATKDVGLDRQGTNTLRVNNGAGGSPSMGKLLSAAATATIAADDTTPDVNGGNVFTTSANSGATAITDLDLPTPGQIVVICGGSDTNSTTIADSGNFNLSAAFTASLDDCIGLFVQADNDYIELYRVNN